MKQVQSLLQPGDCALLCTEIGRRYLTGFPSSLGYLLLTDAASILLVDGRYIEAARQSAKNCEVRLLARLSEQLPQLARELGVRRFLCETELTVATLQRLKSLAGLPLEASAALSERLCALRSIKAPAEIAKIEAAQRIAEKAFADLLDWLRAGVTERQIALELDYRMRLFGADGLSFDTIAVSGPNSSKPHGVPTDRPVQAGDFITMDFGALLDGYHSDMTRTVAVGFATDEMRQVYDTVLHAQTAALSAVRVGAETKAVDRAARDVITSAGYGDGFTHSTGHGVGLEIHEAPTLAPKDTDRLVSGQVVTVEPGVYLPGRFGVRIEDMAAVTDGGCVNLTKSPKNLIIL